MHAPYLVFAYLSPETLLPVTSVIAATLGVVLMLGKNTFRFVVRSCRRLRPRSAKLPAMRGPHPRQPNRVPNDPAAR